MIASKVVVPHAPHGVGPTAPAPGYVHAAARGEDLRPPCRAPTIDDYRTHRRGGRSSKADCSGVKQACRDVPLQGNPPALAFRVSGGDPMESPRVAAPAQIVGGVRLRFGYISTPFDNRFHFYGSNSLRGGPKQGIPLRLRKFRLSRGGSGFRACVHGDRPPQPTCKQEGRQCGGGEAGHRFFGQTENHPRI